MTTPARPQAADYGCLGLIGLFFLSFGFDILMLPVDGWLVKTIWNWFIPEIFEGMPHLTVAHGAALNLVASLLTHQRKAGDESGKTPGELFIETAWTGVFFRVVYLIFAAILHGWMFQ